MDPNAEGRPGRFYLRCASSGFFLQLEGDVDRGGTPALHHPPARLGSSYSIARPFQRTGIVLVPWSTDQPITLRPMDIGSPSTPDVARAISRSPRGTMVDVWVVPGAAKTEITGVHGDALRIRVSAPPEGGKANRAVEQVLATLTGSRVELVRGPGSRRKRFVVENLEPSEVVRLVSRQTD